MKDLAEQLKSDGVGHPPGLGEIFPLRPLLMRRKHLTTHLRVGRELIRLLVANAQRYVAGDPGRLRAILGQDLAPAGPSPLHDAWHTGTWQVNVASHHGTWRFTSFERGTISPDIEGLATLSLAYERSAVSQVLRRDKASLERANSRAVWARSTLQAARRAVPEVRALRVGLLVAAAPSQEEQEEVEEEAAALRRLGVEAARLTVDEADVRSDRISDGFGTFDVMVYDRVAEGIATDAPVPRTVRELQAAASETVFLRSHGTPIYSHDVLLAWLYEARDGYGPRYSRLIHDHVPPTFVVEDRPALFEGTRTSLLNHLETRRDRYVLKGAGLHDGVTLVGRSVDERQWREALEHAVGGHLAVVAQEVVEADEVSVPVWSNGEVRSEGSLRAPTTALYCGGDYAGAHVRLSSSGVAAAPDRSDLRSVLLTLDP
ncbi:hypothetical protein [Streptomyces sp. NPDC127036]|uniref:hypothetical protein n=1 Tax=Streptomyces sp. NPDC127036 TaxID=3347112 RepID=UPI003666CE4C